MKITPIEFSKKLLHWFDQYGRTDLPWQREISPYRVWISEIMLQQTQVSTVIPYFENFMERFPSVTALANAPIDDVLSAWTGLGYYARARHLHKAAKLIQTQYIGQCPDNFPNKIETLQTLPGVGRSTAGAISSIAFKKPAPILDGNVKRVFTRLFAIEGWPGKPDIANKLWTIAEKYTPSTRCADYTQAIMDLGATLCTRAKPACHRCPFKIDCMAHQQQCETAFPHAKSSKSLPIKNTIFLLIANKKGEILLERRPPVGIWGGLWSFPEYSLLLNPEQDFDKGRDKGKDRHKNLNKKISIKTNKRDEHLSSGQNNPLEAGIYKNLTADCLKKYGLPIKITGQLPSFRHTFSHFHLDVTPIQASLSLTPSLMKKSKQFRIMETQDMIWYNKERAKSIGLPAPVKTLLSKMQQD